MSFSSRPLMPTLPLQIAEQIGEQIVGGAYEEGARLREVELADVFSVSRATIREALRILETRQLVTIVPQRGARIVSLSIDELNNLFEIRSALMGLASRRAAARQMPSAPERLAAGLDLLASARQDAASYAARSAQMVKVIADLSGNSHLAEMIEGFAARIKRYAILGLETRQRRERSYKTWLRIAAAIKAGEADEAGMLHEQLARENHQAALAALAMRRAGAGAPGS